MESRALSRYVRMSPRKIRRVADLIKGEPVDRALNILLLTPKAASKALYKTLKSAASNAIASEGTAKVKIENLFVKDIKIDGGPTWKRIRPTGMGRAYMVRKRTAHIGITIIEKQPKVIPAAAQQSAITAKKARRPSGTEDPSIRS
jgi:large subunit ribosomal protein L22